MVSSYWLPSPSVRRRFCLGSSNDIGRNSGMSTDYEASFAILMNFIFLHVLFMLAQADMLGPPCELSKQRTDTRVFGMPLTWPPVHC